MTVAVCCLPSQALASGCPPPQNLEGTYNPQNDTVHLTWDAPDAEGTYTYVVYRGDTLLDDHVTQEEYTDTEPYYVGVYKVYATDSSNQQSTAAVVIVYCPPATVGSPPPFVHPHPECVNW